MAKTVYDIIKKQNGEGFARVLRDKNLLDIPDIANIVKYAGHNAADAEQIFPYLWSLKEFKETENATPGDPFQLLDQAGYHAFEVHNLKEQNSIKRFFRGNEELCTFRDTTRYQQNYIIHAIKHEVWRDPYAIEPSKHPERQDAYGTSVISIQIRKDGSFISIKNRYNHTVNNPDQTFHSNPDEIIPGLSASLKAYFNVDWRQTGIAIPDGFILLNGQILKVNFEINNQYIGDGFYTTSQGEIIDIDKNNQVQMDYFIWDNNTKTLLTPIKLDDDFLHKFNEFIQGKKVTITGKSPNQTILVDGMPVIELENNQIVTLNMPHLETVGYGFLYKNTALTTLNAPNLKTVGYEFLYKNTALTTLNAPNLKKVGDGFLYHNTALTTLNAPNLKTVGHYFLLYNTALTTLNVPNLEKVGYDFLYYNTALTTLNAPNLKTVGDSFLHENTALTTLNAPNLEKVGDNFLYNNTALTTLNAPNLKTVGDGFLSNNTALTTLNAPNLENVGDSFLHENTALTTLNAPNLENVGFGFLYNNTVLTHLNLPKLTCLHDNFMRQNKNIILNLPKLQTVTNGVSAHPATPVINTKITDVFPERRSKVQRFKAAIKQLYQNIQLTYNAHFNQNS